MNADIIILFLRLIFPAIFIVFMVIDYMVLGENFFLVNELMSFPLYVSDLFILLGLMNRSKLFCPSRSLIKSLHEVTPYCVIFGKIF